MTPLTIKPTTNYKFILLYSLSRTALYSLFLLCIIVPLATLVILTDKLTWQHLAIAYIAGTALIFIITFFMIRGTLAKTEYVFYNDRIEGGEKFLTQNKKTVHYKQITNVRQRKGLIEQLFGLGTIFIDTAGSSPSGYELALPFLENPDEVYTWISKIVRQK